LLKVAYHSRDAEEMRALRVVKTLVGFDGSERAHPPAPHAHTDVSFLELLFITRLVTRT